MAHYPYPHAFPGATRASQVPSISLCTCRALCRPRQTLGELTKSLPLYWLLEPLGHRRLHHPRYRGCIKSSGSVKDPALPSGAVSPAACTVPCVRFTCSVRPASLLPLAPPRQMQHSVRVAGWAFPGRDSHPARKRQAFLAHNGLELSGAPMTTQ